MWSARRLMHPTEFSKLQLFVLLKAELLNILSWSSLEMDNCAHLYTTESEEIWLYGALGSEWRAEGRQCEAETDENTSITQI